MDKKSSIRSDLIQRRNELSIELVHQKSRKICKQVMITPEFLEADHVLLYADFRHEVDTKEIFDACLAQKKKVYFPKCIQDTMTFYQIISVMQLENGYWGIKEPKDLTHPYIYNEKDNTLVIIPGVAFDINGYRIGYGKGYYDRFLTDKPYVNKMGLAYSFQMLEQIPKDTYDQKLDKVVTEELVYTFLRI